MNGKRLIAALLLTVTIAGALGVAATASLAFAARLTPLVVGWERFFKLDWEGATVKGRPVVTGHIMNDWGFQAARVQLLVDSLDAGGQVIGQKVAWLGTSLTAGMRAYFEVPVDQPAPAYRVSVYAFEWVQRGGDDLR